MNCSCYSVVILVAHGMDMDKREFKRNLCIIVTFNEMHFCLLLEKATNDMLMLRKLQEEYPAKGNKLSMSSFDVEKVFDRVPGKC